MNLFLDSSFCLRSNRRWRKRSAVQVGGESVNSLVEEGGAGSHSSRCSCRSQRASRLARDKFSRFDPDESGPDLAQSRLLAPLWAAGSFAFEDPPL